MLSKAEYDALTKQLAKCSPEQRRGLALRLMALGAMTTSIPTRDKSEADWLLDGFKWVLSQRGIPLGRGRTVAGLIKVYEAARPEIVAYLDHAIPDLKPPERVALGRLIGRCLAQYVQSFAELSLQMLLQNTQKIPQAVDRAFPGYVEAGLLPMIFHGRRESVMGGSDG